MNTQQRRSAIVDAHEAGQTLAAVVRSIMGGLPWSKSRQLITTGRVIVDGAPVFDPVHRVMGGENVEIDPGARKRRVPELDADRILFVDRDLVVVDKPAGLISVPFDERDTDSLLHRVADRLDHMDVPSADQRKGPSALYTVQRLDKDTTGVLVFARTRKARKGLENQLRKHSIKRRYLALALGRVKGQTVESVLMPDRGDGKRGSWRGSGVRAPKEGKRAVTHVRAEELLNGATLVGCELETGRQHQIRIHLAEAGHPLLGERIYGRGLHPGGPELRAERPMLHAHTLGFVHPISDTFVQYVSPLPADFTTLLDALRK